jgi:hypothetical protein
MEKFNILYLGDNRERYKSGNYYLDWLEAFKSLGNLICYGPGYLTKVDEISNLKFDLIVFSHQFFDSYSIRTIRYFGLNILKYRSTPSIIFSKNEYKKMKRRLILSWVFYNSVLVVYSKASFEKYKNLKQNIHWAPFSPRSDFKNLEGVRHIDFGFRGNSHFNFIGEKRISFVDQIKNEFSSFKKDIKISKNGEDFIQGKNYINWLNSLKFIINTSSAMGIVNPKFSEAMACGVISVSPEENYEGLLEKNIHYVTVEMAKKLLSDKKLYESFLINYKKNSEDYLTKYNYVNQVKFICKFFLKIDSL